MEMTKEDFQEWIRMKLKDELFIEVEEKCKLLQSLLDRRKKLSVHLQQLCRPVFILYLPHALASGCLKRLLAHGPPFGSL